MINPSDDEKSTSAPSDDAGLLEAFGGHFDRVLGDGLSQRLQLIGCAWGRCKVVGDLVEPNTLFVRHRLIGSQDSLDVEERQIKLFQGVARVAAH